MHRARRQLTVGTTEPESLLRRAWRLRRRGEQRRALLTLREICHRTPDDARHWTFYAVQCVKMGKREEAADALKQAAWLRQRDRHDGRARVTRALLARVLAGGETFRLEAA